MSSSYPLIPYGWADFRAIRLEGRLYVDKTRFIRPLEDERFTILIRPRRFGKSCWVSLLENYYDRRWSKEFEQVFGGTDIGCKPTEKRHRYVVLRFDFSAVNDALETLEERFEEYCDIKLRGVLRRDADLFSEEVTRRILAPPSVSGRLSELFEHTGEHGIPLYVLIDEYDNFANTILAHRGAQAYHSFTHGGDFYRNFFATLKAGAGRGGGLERLFITGVSPVTLDDVTSGFNIGKNISLLPEFNAVLGFTETEVRGLLKTYLGAGAISLDLETALDVMREWYDGYRFAKSVEETVYNTDMVLYFLKAAMPNKPMPDDLIDDNVRIDYGKLRHLLTVSRQGTFSQGAHGGYPSQEGAFSRGARGASPSQEKNLGRGAQRDAPRMEKAFSGDRQENAPSVHKAASAVRLNGNFDLLRQIIGEGQADANLQTSFPLERLGQRDNFLSLLHYFGLLSIRCVADGRVRLGIPNQTVRRLLYGHLRDGYDDVGVLSVDMLALADAVWRMAFKGEWRPAFEFLGNTIAEQTGIHDYLDGEKIVQGFLAAYLGVSRHFLLRTEAELGKGFADICLEPMSAHYPQLRHGYLNEVKYLKRSEDASESRVQAAVEEAEGQLRRYLADGRLGRQYPSVEFTGLVVVFRGWEIIVCNAAAQIKR